MNKEPLHDDSSEPELMPVGAGRKSARSRMKKCWKLLRARRRVHANADSAVSAFHSTDRYQMSHYIG